MWLYPLPCLLALAGWLYLYLTAGRLFIGLGLVTLAAGVVAFLLWSRGAGMAVRGGRLILSAGGRIYNAGESTGEWCNGSTNGSGPVSLGSNPSSPG